MVLLVTSPQCDHGTTTIYCFPTVFKKRAVPKRDDSDDKTPAPLVLQENVFIEVSRPKYLEDLHSEALEGLKLMQQEERIIGPDYGDNESTISSVSVRAEVDGGGFTTDSTIPDTCSTVSMQSSVSSRSSRSGLTRQGSTFRPLNSGKKSDKGRMRRRHRKTTGGIPQHVQREFGLDRAEWAVKPQSEDEFVNGGRDVPQLAVHSPPEANNTEVIHPLSSVKEEQLCASQTAHVDVMALLQRLGPAQSGGDRPWSLAVPGMTTAGSSKPGPPSPVMSMSPQAAYLSKIIPNAVLPPSIDVVEISRGRSRNSVRTVSKSSLVLSSPTSSRASSRASTARSTSSRSSTITSASRQNHFHLSDSSCWSNSDSDTLVSDSSTISSSSTPRQTDAQDKAVSKQQNKVGDSPRYPFYGKIIKGNESKKDGQFGHSLSVMKSKRAPPPPNRSYSLHTKMKRRSRDLADIKIIPSQTSEENMKKVIDSPGYNADTSSLDEYSSKTPSPQKALQDVDYTLNNASADASNAKKEAVQVNNHCKVISPSSGYSSQDATSPKNPSPKHKMGLLAKLHKLFPGTTSADLSTSAQPEASKTSNAPVGTVSDKPSVKALRELFTIPPHPKVHAPPPPPPEVWSQSPLSIELLLGPPAPGNTYATVKKNPKDKRPYRPPASTSADSSVRGEEQTQINSISVESKKVHVSQEGFLNVANRTNDCERLMQKNVDVKEHGKVQVSELLNSVLMRTLERETDRLPAIAEEYKTSTQNTKNPSISSAHISPRLPTKQTAEVPTVISLQQVTSPESSWLPPPPPPPVSQTGMGSPDETDFPLPPPPIFTVAEIAIPVLVPPDKPVPNASTSLHGNKAPPLNIPPPPCYTAPPPPMKTCMENFELPSKEVVAPFKMSKPSPPAPKEISHVATETLHPTPAQSTPPAPKLVTIPPPPEAPPAPPQKLQGDIIPKITSEPTEASSSQSVTNLNGPPGSEMTTEVFIPVPQDIPPPSPVEVHPEVSIPTPVVVSTPQTEVTQSPVEIPSPAEVSITQTENVSQTSVEELSRPQEVEPIEMCVQSIKEMSPEPPVEVQSESPPSPNNVSPPISILSPPLEVAPTPPKEISPSKEASSPEIVVEEAAEPQAIEDLPPSVVEERFLPVVVDVSYPMLSEETSTDAVEEALEDSQKTSEEKESSPADEVSAPHAEVKLSEEEILNKNDSSVPPWKSILALPQSIPPPPPAEQPTSDTLPSHEPNKPEEITSQPEPHKPDTVLSQPEVPPPTKSSSPQEEADTILVPSPPIEEVLKLDPPSETAEQQSKELAHASITEEVSQNANSTNDPALNGCPESPKPKDEEETTTQAQTSATNEVPQKPIRKSLVISSPASPPAIVTTQPSPNTAVPTTTVTKSPPVMAASMNLQEAIRLRTAARSHNSPSSRLSIHSPPGFDVRKSPTSTASFIFSKSNKKVVIETRSEAKAEKKTQGLATKASEEQTTKKEFKVPPPVAKKPTPKTKEVETGDTEQTAEQDTHSDDIKENIQKPNGSARIVEGT